MNNTKENNPKFYELCAGILFGAYTIWYLCRMLPVYIRNSFKSIDWAAPAFWAFLVLFTLMLVLRCKRGPFFYLFGTMALVQMYTVSNGMTVVSVMPAVFYLCMAMTFSMTDKDGMKMPLWLKAVLSFMPAVVYLAYSVYCCMHNTFFTSFSIGTLKATLNYLMPLVAYAITGLWVFEELKELVTQPTAVEETTEEAAEAEDTVEEAAEDNADETAEEAVEAVVEADSEEAPAENTNE